MELAPVQHEEHKMEDQGAGPEKEHHYEILDSPGLKAEYIRLTDALIARIVEQQTDVAIFLDKSARPVAWMVNKLWDTLAPPSGPSGETPKRPEIKFLNIDREQWGAILGRSESKVGGINVNQLPSERLDELRALYAPVAGYSDETDQSLLTNKKVMVIDEVRVSGDTAEMAHKILEKAFPDATEITKVYWMSGGVKTSARSGVRLNTQLPVWYSDREVTGRLVGNRDSNKSAESNSGRQRVGRYWLSTPFREPDMKGRQLKEEVKWLAEDLQKHEIIYVPSSMWPDSIDPVEERIERINGISLEEYAGLRKSCASVGELSNLYAAYMRDKEKLNF